MAKKKADKRADKKPDPDDLRPEFRYGWFDHSGHVEPLHASESKKELAGLKIPEGTKPLKFPTDSGFVDVYLAGKESEGKLSREYSRDGRWLCCELTYKAFEKNGSMSGKMSEFFQRIGAFNEAMKGEFSIKGNLFIVLLILFGTIASGYGVFKAVLFH